MKIKSLTYVKHRSRDFKEEKFLGGSRDETLRGKHSFDNANGMFL